MFSTHNLLVGLAILIILAFTLFAISTYGFFVSMMVHVKQASFAATMATRAMESIAQRAPGERLLSETTQTELVCFEFFNADEPEEQDEVSQMLGRAGTWTKPKLGGSTVR